MPLNLAFLIGRIDPYFVCRRGDDTVEIPGARLGWQRGDSEGWTAHLLDDQGDHEDTLLLDDAGDLETIVRRALAWLAKDAAAVAADLGR